MCRSVRRAGVLLLFGLPVLRSELLKLVLMLAVVTHGGIGTASKVN